MKNSIKLLCDARNKAPQKVSAAYLKVLWHVAKSKGADTAGQASGTNQQTLFTC